eukprot:CAMPEP_0174937730 /NCGR_PEP_ID=MMETSP1355-20121228/61360_1 /TAXON_ID=464990 /ORGANISM="Hemiselmis tepida, Strain CCMP443" /LENGTH=99 /DNA_ID=CAMNT_0016184599 /DNA_START=221 /DNA_END=517 /DNA_ORIENTATION=-
MKNEKAIVTTGPVSSQKLQSPCVQPDLSQPGLGTPVTPPFFPDVPFAARVCLPPPPLGDADTAFPLPTAPDVPVDTAFAMPTSTGVSSDTAFAVSPAVL